MGKRKAKRKSKSKRTSKAHSQAAEVNVADLVHTFLAQVASDEMVDLESLDVTYYPAGHQLLGLSRDQQAAALLLAMGHAENAAARRLVAKLMRRRLLTNESRIVQFLRLWIDKRIDPKSLSVARLLTQIEEFKREQPLSDELLVLLHRWQDNCGFRASYRDQSNWLRWWGLVESDQEIVLDQKSRFEMESSGLVERQFVEAIADNPHDVQRRLIYADWLEEQGSERAESIRVWCKRYLLHEPNEEELSQELDEFRLEDGLKSRWSASALHDSEEIELTESGGWLNLTCRWSTLLDHGQEFFRLEPAIGSYTPAGVLTPASASLLVTAGLMEPLLAFDDFQSNAEATRSLLASESACHNLRCVSTMLDGKLIELLTERPYFSQLRELNLRHISLSGPNDPNVFAASFSRSSFLKSLQSLSVVLYDELSEQSVALLATSENLSSLQSLSLHASYGSGRTFTRQMCRALSRSDHLGAIQVLSLESNDLSHPGFEELAQADHFESICDLRLENCGLRSRELASLAESPLAQSLQRLNLADNKFGDEGLARLCRSPALQSLQFLDLRNCGITGKGMRYLRNASFLSQLRWLDLSENQIGDDGVAELVDCGLSGLARLNVEKCEVSAAGMRPLLQRAADLPLRYLNLRRNIITEEGAKTLLAAVDGGLKLRFLSYLPYQVDVSTERDLEQRIPIVKAAYDLR